MRVRGAAHHPHTRRPREAEPVRRAEVVDVVDRIDSRPRRAEQHRCEVRLRGLRDMLRVKRG